MPTTLSNEEVFGGGGFSHESVFPPEDKTAIPDTPWENVRSVLSTAAKRLGMATAAGADMFLGIPGQAIGVGADIGARAAALGSGESRKIQEEAGAAAKEHIPAQIERFLRMAPGGLTKPVQTIIKTLSGEEEYDQASVSKAIDKAAEGIDKATRGYVSAADAKSLLDTAMLYGGVKGTDLAVEAAAKKRTPTGAEARASYAPEEPIPHDEVFGPDLSSIPEPVVVTPKVLKQIFADAKNPVNAVDNLFAAAREGRLPLKPLDGSLLPSGEPKTRLTEGVVIGDHAASGMRKIIADEAGTLTAEERIALQDVIKPRTLVDERGRPLRRDQGGFSDKQLLAILGISTGSIAAGEYIKREHPGLFGEIRARIRQALGAADNRPPPPLDEGEPQPNEDGTFTAGLKDAAPLAAMAVLGRVKDGHVTGSWHPEAVERLARPLSEGITGTRQLPPVRDLEQLAAEDNIKPEAKAAIPLLRWTDKAVSRYLNRYAGTETDPLKDVEVPFGERTEKLGKLMDASIYGEEVEGPRGKETRWDFSHAPYTRAEFQEGDLELEAHGPAAIKSYLSHVGDYLRQNVDPAKLSQYDLVRAVKETAKNDERVAKEMERASLESTKQLPVYKDYGDGMKWVELKLPEKLTEEQAKSVQEVTLERLKKQVNNNEVWRETIKDFREENGGRDPTVAEMHDQLAEYGTPFYRYEAIDPKTGKQITNSYTEEPARGNTPEEAYLAGRLAEEGNQLGHCVGGYCDAVASGESKIYSLRDAKGKSHVTVEVALPRNESSPNFDPRGERATTTTDILQIKGKQNRAPAERYLPYIQDFVRSGKWGEVGDLENAGMIRGNEITGHTNAEGLKLNFDELRHAGVDPSAIYTHKEIGELANKYHERFKGQRGSIDPKLLVRLGAVALGATVGASVSDNKLLGAVIGGVGLGAATKLNAKGAANAVKNAFAADSRIRINQFADAHDAGMARAARAIWQQATGVATLAPEAKDRVALTHLIQGGKNIPPALRLAAQKVKDFFGAMGQAGQDAGVLKALIDNYVTNLWDLTGKNKSKWEEILAKAGGPSMSPESRFALKRKIENLAEGKKLGLVPMTEDVAQIMSIYGNSLARSIENKKMLTALKAATVPGSEQKLVLPSTKAPHSYVTIDHPQMNGIRVHPDIAPSMKFIFDNSDPGVAMRGLEGLNTAIKRSAVSFSLFHAKALVDAQIGAHGMLRGIPKAAKALGQAAAPKLFGENVFLKQLREGGAGDLIDKAQTGGLKISMERGKLADEDVNGSFYTALKSVQQGLDSIVPGMGLPVAAISKVNHLVDVFMWERLHAGMKLGTFAEKLEVLRNSDAKAAAREGRAPKSEADLAAQAASFTNDIYGGLNWRRLGEEARTKWGRDIALSVYSPKGRRALQLLVFAPDWTLSTTRAFTRMFGKIAGYESGSSFRGLLEPQNATDLHRQYVLRSAAYYALVGDSINYALSGHHLWDNKDPTMIDMGDGRTMQWSKHSMEPIHWFTKPGQQALNKLAFLPKEAGNQMLGSEYLSASGHAPRMDTSAAGRVAHVGKSLMPIAGQQAFGEKSSQGGAIAGFLGAPIYGKTFEERQMEKARRRQEAIRRRIEKRQREATR